MGINAVPCLYRIQKAAHYFPGAGASGAPTLAALALDADKFAFLHSSALCPAFPQYKQRFSFILWARSIRVSLPSEPSLLAKSEDFAGGGRLGPGVGPEVGVLLVAGFGGNGGLCVGAGRCEELEDEAGL